MNNVLCITMKWDEGQSIRESAYWKLSILRQSHARLNSQSRIPQAFADLSQSRNSCLPYPLISNRVLGPQKNTLDSSRSFAVVLRLDRLQVPLLLSKQKRSNQSKKCEPFKRLQVGAKGNEVFRITIGVLYNIIKHKLIYAVIYEGSQISKIDNPDLAL